MVVIGVDSHKQTHTAVATDGTGRKLAERTVVATSAGAPGARPLAARFDARTFALED
jgi:transposase